MYEPAPVTMASRIEDCELSIRTSNCLRNAGITHIHMVAGLSDKELLRIANFGRKSLNEIRETVEVARQNSRTPEQRIMDWALENRAFVQALMDGEVAIVPIRRAR